MAGSSKIKSLLSPFDHANLECDGFTRVAHTILVKHHIAHVTRIGKVVWDGQEFYPHFWIELPSGEVVDYRLRMWFGSKAPHGVFRPKNENVTYDGRAVNIPVLNDVLFKVLSGRSINANFDQISNRVVLSVLSASKMGDCYEASGRYMMDHPNNRLVLVHGEVLGQGSLAGIRFGHGWIENGGTVIDVSNGSHRVFPKNLYYVVGDIQRTFKYRYEEFIKWIVKTGNWGPWELKTNR